MQALKNKKILVILTSIFFGNLFFYFDIFDLDIFNQKYIQELESKIKELEKIKDEQEKQNDQIMSQSIDISKEIEPKNNSNTILYIALGSILIIGVVALYFYYGSNSGDNNSDLCNCIMDTTINHTITGTNKSTLSRISEKDINFIQEFLVGGMPDMGDSFLTKVSEENIKTMKDSIAEGIKSNYNISKHLLQIQRQVGDIDTKQTLLGSFLKFWPELKKVNQSLIKMYRIVEQIINGKYE